MRLARCTGIQVKGEEVHTIEDEIVVEERVRLHLNGRFLTRQVASPEHLAELGAGFVICEGLSDTVDSVRVSGADVLIDAPVAGEYAMEVESSGGNRVIREPRTVQSDLTITPDDVFRITRASESESWRKTRGVHCSVLFSKGELETRICDVGRHNTVDKAVGHAVLKGLDRSRCVLGCTGRQPAGMVAKVANAGIPIIISRAASSDAGIATANKAGVTLICFSRENRFTVYTHPERVPSLSGKMEKI